MHRLLALAVLLVAADLVLPSLLPERSAARPMTVPTAADLDLDRELLAGCRHLVELVEVRSDAAVWAIPRLQDAATGAAYGTEVNALAHRGLALAYRLGSGVTVDAERAEAHALAAERLRPADGRLAMR